MILKLRIDSQDLNGLVPETYPAAEPDALDDIVLVDVVVPPKVQMRSYVDHQRFYRK
jgi:hypothetical protein